jgi:hypothetical protein
MTPSGITPALEIVENVVLAILPISFLPLISAESNGALAAKFGFPEGSREAVPNPTWRWRMECQGREVPGAAGWFALARVHQRGKSPVADIKVDLVDPAGCRPALKLNS